MGSIARDFTPDDLEPHLEARGLTGCIAVQARTHERENEYLLGLAEAHRSILGVVGWLDVAAPALPQRLDETADHPRLVGFREILQGEPETKFLNADFIAGLRLLGERGYAYDVLIHSTQLPATAELVRSARPDQRLVLDHLGKPDIKGGRLADWAPRIRSLAKDHPNLHCKLSGMVTEAAPGWTADDLRPYMETVIDAFGPKRVMYGSDWPVCLLNAKDYAAVHDVAFAFVSTLGADAASDIFGGNAERFYRLTDRRPAGASVR